MPADLYLRLLAIFVIVALGYAAGRARWVGEGDVSRVLSNAAFVLFMPALLFRTTARIDFASLQVGDACGLFRAGARALLATYLWERRRAGASAATPSVRAISAGFGNTVQLGIPIAAALFGESGLALHVAIVSLHALIVLTAVTALVEHDLARARSREAGVPHRLRGTLVSTVRNTVIHPVVLPVIAGLLWNLLGAPLPGTVDEVLKLLGQAAVPLCLVIIGLSFGEHGLRALRSAGGAAIAISAAKLVLLPALVLALGYAVFGFGGTTLAVVVMAAALPIGANALIFAQRYDCDVPETTVAIVLSTLAFVASAPLWLLVLGALNRRLTCGRALSCATRHHGAHRSQQGARHDPAPLDCRRRAVRRGRCARCRPDTDQPDDQARRHADRRAGLSRLRLHRQESVAGAQVERCAGRHEELCLTVYDPDAPTGSGWWHWVVYNIPATTTELPEGAGAADGKALPAGAMQGRTDFGTPGFGGACPPKGDRPHRYIFTVYALKTDKLDVPPDATAALVGFMINANLLGKASFTAKYGRK